MSLILSMIEIRWDSYPCCWVELFFAEPSTSLGTQAPAQIPTYLFAIAPCSTFQIWAMAMFEVSMESQGAALKKGMFGMVQNGTKLTVFKGRKHKRPLFWTDWHHGPLHSCERVTAAVATYKRYCCKLPSNLGSCCWLAESLPFVDNAPHIVYTYVISNIQNIQPCLGRR